MANDAPYEDMYSWYENLYPMVERSKAYSGFCVRLYGIDLSQQGFSDMNQMNFMVEQLDLRPRKDLLDIGCGTGKMAEHISDITGANAIGFDYSPTAIRLACERTTAKRNRLKYEVGVIGEKQYPNDCFDAIIAIDTIFFAEDLTNALKDIYIWLRPKGIMAIWGGGFRFSDDIPLETLLPDSTDVARALISSKIKYTLFDFSNDHYEHMKRKRKIALELRSSFEDEGTMMLYEYIYRESIDESVALNEFLELSTRYLYVCEKQE